MKLARVARMRPAELADRMRQENLKVLERLRIVRAGELSPEVLPLDAFRQVAPARFFPGASDRKVPLLIAERVPQARARVLEAAGNALEGRFDLLGYHALDFGVPLDWQLDPVSGTRAPREHWTRIDPLDRDAVGDHKVVWELNRHQWLLHLAQAYAFTGDDTYAERCLEMLEDWVRANPVGWGINWASSLELAFRLIAWSWLLVLLRDCPALTPERFARILGSIHAQATHVARYLSTTYSPNTHLLGEALGLFYVGVLFPEIDDEARWRTTAQRVLTAEATRQILRDGVCFEQSTYYQRYTVEMYLHFLLLAQRNGVQVPAVVGERVSRCMDFLLALRRADGSVPQIGDGDGGWLLPLHPRNSEDMRGVFALAGALFERADCAGAAGTSNAEPLWLLGARGLEHDRSTVSLQPPLASRLFEDGGYAVMRSSHDDAAHTLALDCGPLGCPISGAHGHADLLSLTCDVFGAPCIVDPGMPTYGGDARWRDAFRSTHLHSTVVVDGLSQASPSGPFSWQERPSARLRAWASNDDYDLADAQHEAYSERCDGLIHRRRVIFIKPRYWVVIDDLDDRGCGRARRIELGFQFAPGHSLTPEGGWLRAAARERHALLVRASSAVRLVATVHEGELAAEPLRGWFSPAYGRATAAPALVYRATAPLPFRAVTYLVPLAADAAPPPEPFPQEPDASLIERLSL